MREVPVLLYHNVGHYPDEMMEDGLLPETFVEQMQYFAENGYTIVSLEQAVDHLNGYSKLPPKSTAITIDGGYGDAYTNVFPILKKHNWTTTFFVVPEAIGRERLIKGKSIACMTWDEVRALSDAGMEIGLLANGGAGIRDHYDENLLKESISNSLNLMRNNFQKQIRFCAFKEGVPGASLWNFIQTLGIKAVFTQCPTNQAATLAGIGRIQIDDDDHNIFLTKISNTYLFFKDRPSWKYIRKYHMDKLVHHLSETWNRIKG
ncbi:MAG: hypothetical protein FJ139_11540 [Deltaproteobacteria bacterium]|nr:hypothetical protein [Deltaproteobacteria bacterium]